MRSFNFRNYHKVIVNHGEQLRGAVDQDRMLIQLYRLGTCGNTISNVPTYIRKFTYLDLISERY